MPAKTHTSPYTSEPYYRLPESALVELGRIRDELDMLAELILCACSCDESMHMISLAFSQYFLEMSVGIAEAMDACGVSADHVDPMGHSRH
ncbi:XAC0095 family protein [Dyella flava]|uniref:DUF3077 domain-containing protein n=1 Tax=Dyella flava TaxID=1920170 RepID=A0ABS2JYY5_9GAMM|nr:hypothetical protein [Dyella flava]MBM7124096.1 hypothetical protein [Dyella flava]GLQ49996.1 hypothetical protein GCM10010872_14450 [Dyella flava]